MRFRGVRRDPHRRIDGRLPLDRVVKCELGVAEHAVGEREPGIAGDR